MDLPTILYKVPGPYKAPGGKGKTYDYIGVETQEELDVLLGDGWFLTIQDAQDGKVYSDDAPPTREEIIAKAEELGIKVDKRASNDKIMALIAEKIGG